MEIKMETSWKNALSDLFDKPYFSQIADHLKAEKSLKTSIYPTGGLIFNAFTLTPYQKVKVIILGQDPYHNPHQAMGLSFSVPDGIKPPPSLVNIFKELHKDIGMPIPSSGDLTHWATQGVLLLNSALTVRADEPGSHSKIGWTQFTDDLIQLLSKEKSDLVFILWGNYARQKGAHINRKKHLVIESAHPSPFSATAFFGGKHFSKTNDYLKRHGKKPIQWLE